MDSLTNFFTDTPKDPIQFQNAPTQIQNDPHLDLFECLVSSKECKKIIETLETDFIFNMLRKRFPNNNKLFVVNGDSIDIKASAYTNKYKLFNSYMTKYKCLTLSSDFTSNTLKTLLLKIKVCLSDCVYKSAYGLVSNNAKVAIDWSSTISVCCIDFEDETVKTTYTFDIFYDMGISFLELLPYYSLPNDHLKIVLYDLVNMK